MAFLIATLAVTLGCCLVDSLWLNPLGISLSALCSKRVQYFFEACFNRACRGRQPRQSSCRLSINILTAAILISVGCTQDVVQLDRESTVGTGDDQIHRGVDHQPTMVLNHDFGLVRPNTHSKTSFAITNNTDKSWKIERIGNNCACTTVGVTSFEIHPGCCSSLELMYRAGKDSGDDERRVTVELSGETAPIVELNVKANIRAPLTVLPKELNVGRISADRSSAEAFLIVQNVTEASWNEIKVHSQTPWLHCAIDREFDVGQETESTDPKQQWRIRVTAQCDGLSPGVHEAVAVVTAESSTNEKLDETVPIRVTLVNPVSCVPGQIFYSRNSTEAAPRSAKVSLYFADNIATNAQNCEVTLSQHPENILHLNWEKQTGPLWVLNATLTAEHLSESRVGDIIVSFGSKSIDPIRIPYRYVY